MSKFFDEASLYSSHKRHSMRKLAVWLVLGVLFAALLVASQVKAQTTKVRQGQVVTTTTVLCNTRAEAAKALAILHDAGKEGVEAYVADTENTCEIGTYMFIVGATVGLSQKDPENAEWTVIEVHPLGDPSQTDYVLARVSALDLASY